MKWFKSRASLGEIGWDAVDLTVTDSGDVHRISFQYGFHHKTTLKAIIDPTLFGSYREKYENLCRGFVKEEASICGVDEMDNELVVADIAAIVQAFFTFFCMNLKVLYVHLVL